jgi:hypothetical protein
MIKFVRFFLKGPGLFLLLVLVGIGVLWEINQSNQRKKEAAAKNVVQRPLGQLNPKPEVDKSQAAKDIVIPGMTLTPDVTGQTDTGSRTFIQQGPTTIPVQSTVVFFNDIKDQPPTATEAPVKEEKAIPKAFLQVGELIPCLLVNTVNSSHIDTPVIGIVSRNVFARASGELVIPAGSRIVSFAQSGAVRDRIEVKGEWALVFPDDKRLNIRAVALTRQADESNSHFGDEDASAGLSGELVESDQWANAKIFLGTALSGAMQAAQTTTNTVYGPAYERSAENVGLNAGSAVIDRYTQRLLDGENGDGRYVHVHAASEFYLLPMEPIIPEKRSIFGDNDNSSQQSAKDQAKTVNAAPTAINVSDKAVQDALAIEKELLKTPDINPTPSPNGYHTAPLHF